MAESISDNPRGESNSYRDRCKSQPHTDNANTMVHPNGANYTGDWLAIKAEYMRAYITNKRSNPRGHSIGSVRWIISEPMWRTCAWIIEGTNKTNRIEGSMVAPGNTGDHSAFRSKAAGLYGLLLTMW